MLCLENVCSNNDCASEQPNGRLLSRTICCGESSFYFQPNKTTSVWILEKRLIAFSTLVHQEFLHFPASLVMLTIKQRCGIWICVVRVGISGEHYEEISTKTLPSEYIFRMKITMLIIGQMLSSGETFMMFKISKFILQLFLK